MRLGIGSYTYGWASGAYGFSDPDVPTPARLMDSGDLIDRAERLGVEVVQLCFRPALHELSDSELDTIRDHAAGKGIALEVGTSGADPGLLRRYAEIAARLDARLVRTIFPAASPGLREESAVVRDVMDAYRANGVLLAVENHEDCASRDLVRLVREHDARYLGVCLDSVNSLGRGEGVREVVDLLLPHAASVHIKDFTTRRRPSGMGFEVTGAPTGQGRLDVSWLLGEAARECPHASVVLEQWSDFQGTIEASIQDQERAAAAGIRYLRDLLDSTEDVR